VVEKTGAGQSGTPFYRAHSEKNQDFVKLLEENGGFLDAISAGYACQTEAARRLLEDEAAGRLRPGSVNPGDTVAEELIWTGAGGGDAEIVRMVGNTPGRALLLGRVDPNLSDHGRTILHTVMARGGPEHVPFVENAAGLRGADRFTR
jgi:hypothetical protein